MKIDGKLIASTIKETLKEQVSSLGKIHIIPHLAVILIGNDSSSVTYVAQKTKAADFIGAKITVIRKSADFDANKLPLIIQKLNNDPQVHGIIIQRPLPFSYDPNKLDNMVIPTKDVDGFHPKTTFAPPVASAVMKILDWIKNDLNKNNRKKILLTDWLKIQKILVIGRGETAGKPIANYMKKNTIKIDIAHSQTTNIKKLCLSSDIIITCVGRPHIVRHDMVNKKTILIGVGLHPENDKLQTDYIQDEISEKVAYYTPVPGGIGPVNVSCLFENLLAASISSASQVY